MSAQSIGWHDEQDDSERRRVRRAMSISIGVHVAFFLALVIAPPSSREPIPDVIAIELIGGPQIAAPVAPRAPVRRKAPPPPPAPKPPAEQAAPEPPAPAPPKPKAPVQVLPENERKPEKKVQQAPEKKTQEVAKAQTEPAPEKKQPEKPPAKKPVQEADESLSYEDAMNSLDEELGEDTTDDLLAPPPPRPGTRTTPTSGNAPESQAGASVNAEDAAWGLAMRRRIQSKWVALSQYQGRGLVTVMALEITPTGDLVGEPEVVRTSGDPFFDDHAVQGVLMSRPLPVPPNPGRRILIFKSEDY
ncbi:MAG: cell envelope integrity protein TolA [Myxococcota bacterium]